MREKEVAKIIHGDKNVSEAISRFISTANSRIDACVDRTRPALGTNIEQIKALILNSRKRGIRSRCITEITTNNIHYCKQLLEIVDELRHLDNIAGSFYVSDKEYLVPERFHKKGKPASQIIYCNVKETLKQQQYVFGFLWNRAISAQQKINQIEKGDLPEVIEIIRDRVKGLQLAQELIRSSQEEIIAILSSANAFMRQIKAGNDQIILEAAKHRNVSVTILTPMDKNVRTIANDLEKQCANIKIRKIEPFSPRSTVTAVITDRKFSLAAELRDDSKSKASEAIGDIIYSTSKPTVLSYVSMFENYMRLTRLYEESQSKLSDTTDELESMKRYVKEVLEIRRIEMDKFKKSRV
jgi:two-component system sensor histidine kinase VicK